jgi:outer membrane protein OmpA-like peptidoglycan-associated protein
MFRVLNGAKAAVFALAATMASLTFPIVARSAELLILAESDANLVTDCTGKDVAVSGSNGKIILTGGCRSLTISGHNNQVLAEIASGGELTVLRTGNAVIWTKIGEGPTPAVTADQTNMAIEMGANGVKLADGRAAPDAKPQEPAKTTEPEKTAPSAKIPQANKSAGTTIKPAEAARPAQSPSPSAKPIGAKISTRVAAISTPSRRPAQTRRLHAQPGGRKVPLIGFVVFSDNSDLISPKSAPALNRVAAKIRHSSGSKIRVVGHADANSTGMNAKLLAKRRAQAVATWLIRHAKLSRQALSIEVIAGQKTHRGLGERSFFGRVNIVVVPRQGARAHRAGDQGSGAQVETTHDRTIIDLRNSPISSWGEDTGPVQNLKKSAPGKAGSAATPPNP